MQVEDLGLEDILRRKRFFLIDTNVLFGGPASNNELEDDVVKIAADAASRHHTFDRMQQVYDVIRTHDNVRLTPEVSREMLRVLGGLHEGYKHNPKIRRVIESVDHYLRNHRYDLVIGDAFWDKGRMAFAGYAIQDEVAKRYPNRPELSWEDTSLLLKALEVRLFNDTTYRKLDIISSDFLVKAGAETMFDILDSLPVGTPREKRAVRFQCMKLIWRMYGEQYHDVFNSHEYCAQKRK